jgi:hypothetical protein
LTNCYKINESARLIKGRKFLNKPFGYSALTKKEKIPYSKAQTLLFGGKLVP